MLTDEQEFIKAAVLGELYWKTSKGPKLSEKLKKKFPNFKQEEYQDYIDHIKNLIQDPIRIAGFGGWNKDITEKDIKKYKKSGYYDKFVNTCKKGKIKFVEWYLTKAHAKGKESRCCYCGISEEDSNKFLPEYSKREGNRGGYLEIERINTAPGYNIYKEENCALACYVCNNAKSNIFSKTEFMEYMVPGIQKFWENRRKNQK